MANPGNDQTGKPATVNPDPGCNTGYAEPKPRTKEQAREPGAKQAPDSEEGGLEHDPDQGT